MTSTNKAPDVAVYIGRFQIFHNAQLALLRRALAAAPECVVVLGSAFQARTPRNPFTWRERAEMIRVALPEAERQRLKFLPVRDHYDSARWVAAVKQGLARLHPGQPSVVLVGHLKDATSSYLRDFPGWALDDAGRRGDIHASALRDAYFGAARDGSLEPALAALAGQAPDSTLQFLRAWASLPPYAVLAQEWESLRREKALWAGSPYPPVFVTVDAIVQCGRQVLLIRRGRSPGKGLLAVPGGFSSRARPCGSRPCASWKRKPACAFWTATSKPPSRRCRCSTTPTAASAAASSPTRTGSTWARAARPSSSPATTPRTPGGCPSTSWPAWRTSSMTTTSTSSTSSSG